jgi:hypothetical protein
MRRDLTRFVVNPYVLHDADCNTNTTPATASPVAERPPTSPAVPSAAQNVRQFLREIGRRGGQARAARHSRDELATFGRVRHKTKAAT